MEKIIQIATCAASNGHSLYALTSDGRVYERVYNVQVTQGGVVHDMWQEIPHKKFD